MKEIVTKNGTHFTIAWAYGVLQKIDTLLFQGISDEGMEGVKSSLMMSRQEDVDLQDVKGAARMKFFSGGDIKAFILADTEVSTRLLATLVRSRDGVSIGSNFEERYEYCMEELDIAEGEQLAWVISDWLEDQDSEFKEKKRGELEPISNKPNDQGTAGVAIGSVPSPQA